MAYIDKDLLKTRLKQLLDYPMKMIYVIIDDLPTADVVEVVRCKDCAKKGTPKCPSLLINIQLNGVVCRDHCFCSYGERKE